MRAAVFSCLAGSVLLAAALSARGGVIELYAPNKVFMLADASAKFFGDTSTLSTFDSDTAVASVPGELGYDNDAFADSGLLLPFSGAPKDQAHGAMTVYFAAGAGALADSFSFTMNGMASAVAATAAAGDPARANVKLKGFFVFYLDPLFSGVPAGSLVGNLAFDAPRPLLPYENFNLQVVGSSGLLLSLFPGAAATSLPLYVGQGYEVTMQYEMVVPHGIDPEIALSLGGTLTAVPEPMQAGLLGVGLALLWAKRTAGLRSLTDNE